MKRLNNKIALITGAAGGQGREEAILFSKHGATVIATDVNEEGLKETIDLIKNAGGVAISFRHDISDEKDWIHIINEVEKQFSRIDILVNNAGILNRAKLEELTIEDFEKMHTVNTRGTFLGMKNVVPVMKKHGGGSIINISSIWGLVGSEGSLAYHASKGAIRLMTKAAAVDLAKYYIRVNSIHPGVIETPMTSVYKGEHPLKSATPWPELGKPIDIAYGALYLASDESRFVTGTELVIDGGYTAK